MVARLCAWQAPWPLPGCGALCLPAVNAIAHTSQPCLSLPPQGTLPGVCLLLLWRGLGIVKVTRAWALPRRVCRSGRKGPDVGRKLKGHGKQVPLQVANASVGGSGLLHTRSWCSIRGGKHPF